MHFKVTIKFYSVMHLEAVIEQVLGRAWRLQSYNPMMHWEAIIV
jgi:hypothetical protein